MGCLHNFDCPASNMDSGHWPASLPAFVYPPTEPLSVLWPSIIHVYIYTVAIGPMMKEGEKENSQIGKKRRSDGRETRHISAS